MEKTFFDRFQQYYEEVGSVLRGKADGAKIFPNPVDKGCSREDIYINFLKLHAPVGCSIFSGGFLFNKKGDESKQIDIIVTCDSAPQYNFFNEEGSGKSFACIDGTIAIISVKSYLDSKELIDALENIASIPDRDDPEFELVDIRDLEDWPFKVIFAFDGINHTTLTKTIEDFYQKNPHIPMKKRPSFIHVAGNGYIIRMLEITKTNPDGSKEPVNLGLVNGVALKLGNFYVLPDSTDVWGLAFVQNHIQQKAMASRFIIYGYFDLIDKFKLGKCFKKE